MPIEITPEELFETSGAPDESGFTAPPSMEPAAPAPPPAAPAPAYDPRVDSLQHTLNALLTRPQPQPAYQPPPPPQEAQQGWKPRDFFTPDDARLLLTSQDPASALNRSYNNVAEQVYNSLAQELNKRDVILLGMHQQQEAYRQEQTRRERAATNQVIFHQLYPDLAAPAYAPLVAHEAQAIAYESQTNPAAFVNRTDHDIYAILAQRVQARAAAFAGGDQPAYTAPAPTPQRTYMERGSGARQGDGGSPDANTRALREMTRFKRLGR